MNICNAGYGKNVACSIIVAAAFLNSLPSHAQSLSARGSNGNADFKRLEALYGGLKTQLDALSSALADVNACLAKGQFYAPGHSRAVGNCLSEDDPQVGFLSIR
jgi:hypothetical protein